MCPTSPPKVRMVYHPWKVSLQYVPVTTFPQRCQGTLRGWEPALVTQDPLHDALTLRFADGSLVPPTASALSMGSIIIYSSFWELLYSLLTWVTEPEISWRHDLQSILLFRFVQMTLLFSQILIPCKYSTIIVRENGWTHSWWPDGSWTPDSPGL